MTALAGDLDETIALAQRFAEGWERAGRPRAGNPKIGAHAAAMAHGLRGDDDARAAWLNIVDTLGVPGHSTAELHFGQVFDAILLLHRGLTQQAALVLQTPPEQLANWHGIVWRTWYAALWAEAAVLSGHEDAAARIQLARAAAVGNPVAIAIVDRAAAVAAGASGRDGLSAAAAALGATGCRYQWARTLVLIGGEGRASGEAMLAAMGATPMVWPPE